MKWKVINNLKFYGLT